MRDDETPPRLSLSGSPELRTALRGLAKRAPESERVARIARNVALATGVRPELLMPPLSDGAGAPPDVTLEPTQTSGLTSTFGTGAKIVAASAVVAVTGLLGYWASARHHSEHSDRAVSVATPALASLRATTVGKTADPSARSTPAVRKQGASPVASPHSRESATPEPTRIEQQPAREKRSHERTLTAKEAPVGSRAPRAVPTPSASAVVGSSQADPRDRAEGGAAPASVEHGKAAAADELGLLHLAQSALRIRPAHALHLVDQHRREFPRSGLAQERDLIQVSALVRLGRIGEARTHAERFRRVYPRSAYGKQLDTILPKH